MRNSKSLSTRPCSGHRIQQVSGLVLLSIGLSWHALGQTAPTFDVSGDAQLTGGYNFRHVSYFVNDGSGNLSRSVSLIGTVQFDGAGNYSITATEMDSGVSTTTPQAFTTAGTYGIAASGVGWISNPISSEDFIYGLVSNGIFVGSSTESLINDLFIAASVPTTLPTAAALNGTYQFATMDYPGLSSAVSRSTSFGLIADGSGGISGPVTVTGSNAGQPGLSETHTVSYSFTNGIGTVSFGNPASMPASVLIAGDELVMVSQDGGFVFGGSATGWDMLVGVRSGSGLTNAAFAGLHFQAGVDENVAQFSTGTATLDTYYGSINTSDGLIVGHQRINALTNTSPYDYTYGDSYALNPDGTYNDLGQSVNYVVGASGVRIGFDTGSYLGINVTIPAAPLTGSGVFLNPQGVVNAASFAPFTASIAPGEFVSIYGTNLAAATQSATAVPFGGSLGNVQVMINGIAAPLALVSPGFISAVIPYGISDPVAAIQVINGGVASNVVTMYVDLTAPGVFTFPSDGLGSSAALHLDYSVVTTDDPATTGETLAVFVGGLGAVLPSVQEGSAAPGSPLSYTTNLINVNIDGQAAIVSYAGLAPGFAGLYQLNVIVPVGIHSGSVSFDVSGPDSYTSEAVLPIAPGSGTLAASAAVPSRHRGVSSQIERAGRFR